MITRMTLMPTTKTKTTTKKVTPRKTPNFKTICVVLLNEQFDSLSCLPYAQIVAANHDIVLEFTPGP